ncbi:hypothetical protein [Ruminococcus sp.]|uniref:hypothetical protein n=1 Tax=Ruminococcus sp. TaxID=41978 RepID=UPI0035295169
MSKKIKEVIYLLLQDGKVHSVEEMQKECMAKEIINKEQVGNVRGVIFNLKKEDVRILTVGRGKYKLDISNRNLDNIISEQKINDAIEILEKRLTELKEINWITTSDEELRIARKQIKKMENLTEKVICLKSRK